MPPVDVYVGDVVTLRKPHPCGSFEWEVTRIGADIGIKCHGCGRRVMLTRREFNKRVKTFVTRAAPPDAADPAL
ncbi:MAG: DUF951 domain-containing protein [Anaerolineae bacterium]